MMINLSYKKSTKGTHVYEDLNDDAVIPTLYIKKFAFPDEEAPASLNLIIDFQEEEAEVTEE